ncbi:hypothetical protein VP1G_10378 [Cytospora mali]|uniref:Uncharacterized protein n=1 Tax=Cytospora mali TaxID=578113 RepID=A0A194VGU7_CYTMA|nr:hypothetical protein VP1G_10378 [Valsa mali var. pyri (nom. inval.)]
MVTRETPVFANQGRGAYDTTGVPKPPPQPKPRTNRNNGRGPQASPAMRNKTLWRPNRSVISSYGQVTPRTSNPELRAESTVLTCSEEAPTLICFLDLHYFTNYDDFNRCAADAHIIYRVPTICFFN